MPTKMARIATDKTPCGEHSEMGRFSDEGPRMVR